MPPSFPPPNPPENCKLVICDCKLEITVNIELVILNVYCVFLYM